MKKLAGVTTFALSLTGIAVASAANGPGAAPQPPTVPGRPSTAVSNGPVLPVATGIRRAGVPLGVAAPVDPSGAMWEVEVFNPTQKAQTVRVYFDRPASPDHGKTMQLETVAAGEHKWVTFHENQPLRDGPCASSVEYRAIVTAEYVGDKADSTPFNGAATVACTFSAFNPIAPRVGVPQQGRITIDSATVTNSGPLACGAPLHWKAHVTNNTGQAFTSLQLTADQKIGAPFALGAGQQVNVEGDSKLTGSVLLDVVAAGAPGPTPAQAPLGQPGASVISTCTMSFGQGLVAQHLQHPVPR